MSDYTNPNGSLNSMGKASLGLGILDNAISFYNAYNNNKNFKKQMDMAKFDLNNNIKNYNNRRQDKLLGSMGSMTEDQYQRRLEHERAMRLNEYQK